MRWAVPRMRHLRKLGADLTASDALQFLTIAGATQDLSGLQDLEVFGVAGNQYCTTVLAGLLRQARVLIDQRLFSDQRCMAAL